MPGFVVSLKRIAEICLVCKGIKSVDVDLVDARFIN